MSGLPKILYFIYQGGKMDCVCFSLTNAHEMAIDPEDGDKSNFYIEVWQLNKENKYEYKRKLKWK